MHDKGRAQVDRPSGLSRQACSNPSWTAALSWGHFQIVQLLVLHAGLTASACQLFAHIWPSSKALAIVLLNSLPASHLGAYAERRHDSKKRMCNKAGITTVMLLRHNWSATPFCCSSAALHLCARAHVCSACFIMLGFEIRVVPTS